MADSKEGILPLVGRVIKKRLEEVKQEVAHEVGEGLSELKQELEDDLTANDPKPPLTRIELDEE